MLLTSLPFDYALIDRGDRVRVPAPRPKGRGRRPDAPRA
jgi:hypothetical protein